MVHTNACFSPTSCNEFCGGNKYRHLYKDHVDSGLFMELIGTHTGVLASLSFQLATVLQMPQIAPR